MTIRPAKRSSTKCRSEVKSFDFGPNAVLEEKSYVRDERQASTLKRIENRGFKPCWQRSDFCFRNKKRRLKLVKTNVCDEQFRRIMNRYIARWEFVRTGTLQNCEPMHAMKLITLSWKMMHFPVTMILVMTTASSIATIKTNLILWTTVSSFQTFVSQTIILKLLSGLPSF